LEWIVLVLSIKGLKIVPEQCVFLRDIFLWSRSFRVREPCESWTESFCLRKIFWGPHWNFSCDFYFFCSLPCHPDDISLFCLNCSLNHHRSSSQAFTNLLKVFKVIASKPSLPQTGTTFQYTHVHMNIWTFYWIRMDWTECLNKLIVSIVSLNCDCWVDWKLNHKIDSKESFSDFKVNYACEMGHLKWIIWLNELFELNHKSYSYSGLWISFSVFNENILIQIIRLGKHFEGV